MKFLSWAVIIVTILSISYITISREYDTVVSDTIDVEEVVQLEEQEAQSSEEVIENSGWIFIGDSRFVGMDTICNINNSYNKFVVAKESEGYDYLINTALNEAKEIIYENTDITNWSYIICLGINDLYNINKYVEKYNDIKNDIDLVLVSVNPVEYHSVISNDDIKDFNEKLKYIDNTKYIDTFSDMLNTGFSTVDGIHYTGETYEKLYLEICSKLNIQERN